MAFRLQTPVQRLFVMESIRTKKKSRKINKFWLLKEYVFEYGYIFLTNSSAHGLSHIAASRRHYLEVLLWTAAVCCGVLGACWLCISTWNRYQRSPTVISLEKNYLDWNTTFPAATMCPLSKVEPAAGERLAKDLFPDLPPTEGARKLELLANASYHNFETVEDLDGLSPEKYLQVLQKIKFNFTYSLSNSNSDPAFLIVTLTEAGLCYTYNSEIAVYNSPRYWTKKKWAIETPIELFHGNPLDGDIFAQLMDMNSGLRATIHGPEELAEFTSKWHITEPMHFLTVDLSALTIYSSEETRGLRVKQRGCRFSEESNLETSPVYSYNLCRSECRMRLAHSLCSCVPYFYRNTGKYPICGVEGMRCLSKYKERLIKLRDDKGEREKCGCYPSCDDVNYAVLEVASVDWFLGSNFKYSLAKYPTSRLKRDVVFGVGDLLVQFGGTVGLCLGCSLLSIAELGYFLSLRLILFIADKATGGK